MRQDYHFFSDTGQKYGSENHDRSGVIRYEGDVQRAEGYWPTVNDKLVKAASAAADGLQNAEAGTTFTVATWDPVQKAIHLTAVGDSPAWVFELAEDSTSAYLLTSHRPANPYFLPVIDAVLGGRGFGAQSIRKLEQNSTLHHRFNLIHPNNPHILLVASDGLLDHFTDAPHEMSEEEAYAHVAEQFRQAGKFYADVIHTHRQKTGNKLNFKELAEEIDAAARSLLDQGHLRDNTTFGLIALNDRPITALIADGNHEEGYKAATAAIEGAIKTLEPSVGGERQHRLFSNAREACTRRLSAALATTQTALTNLRTRSAHRVENLKSFIRGSAEKDLASAPEATAAENKNLAALLSEAAKTQLQRGKKWSAGLRTSLKNKWGGPRAADPAVSSAAEEAPALTAPSPAYPLTAENGMVRIDMYGGEGFMHPTYVAPSQRPHLSASSVSSASYSSSTSSYTPEPAAAEGILAKTAEMAEKIATHPATLVVGVVTAGYLLGKDHAATKAANDPFYLQTMNR